jgi:hypothetical protein
MSGSLNIAYRRETTKPQLNPECRQDPTTRPADPAIPSDEMVMKM